MTSPSLSVAALPGWMPELIAQPGFIAAYRTPAQRAGSFQSVNACACAYKGPPDEFIGYEKVSLLNSGAVLLSQKSTTICGGEAAWRNRIPRTDAPPGSKPAIELHVEQVAAVKGGIAYVAVYARPSGLTGQGRRRELDSFLLHASHLTTFVSGHAKQNGATEQEETGVELFTVFETKVTDRRGAGASSESALQKCIFCVAHADCQIGPAYADIPNIAQFSHRERSEKFFGVPAFW